MKMKKIGVTGFKGKLGSLLIKREGYIPLDMDITNKLSIEKELKYHPVDMIVNCASISSIDECERDYEKALKVNTYGLHNLFSVFGKYILNIGTDQVYDGHSSKRTEKDKPNPINSYGYTKMGAEALCHVHQGKTLRLSRTVSFNDFDINGYINSLWNNQSIYVPSFFYRNYLHRTYAIDGITYFVEHYDSMPDIVNYGGEENCSMYDLMMLIGGAFRQEPSLICRRVEDLENMTKRPHRAGYRIDLAKSLGFPMYSLYDTVSRIFTEKESII
jgi:dTDP-4-dehydrorhamnose reductase